MRTDISGEIPEYQLCRHGSIVCESCAEDRGYVRCLEWAREKIWAKLKKHAETHATTSMIQSTEGSYQRGLHDALSLIDEEIRVVGECK